MTLKIMNSTSQAAPVWEPKNRLWRPILAGLLIRRMTMNITMPMITSTPKRSSRKPTIAQRPTIGTAKSGMNSAPKASRIVSPSTRKPQKANTCAMPGTVHLRSFFWPSTSVASAPTALSTFCGRSTAG